MDIIMPWGGLWWTILYTHTYTKLRHKLAKNSFWRHISVERCVYTQHSLGGNTKLMGDTKVKPPKRQKLLYFV